MSKGPWPFRPKIVKQAEKILTEAGHKIVAFIWHPDGSFEFRTGTEDAQPAVEDAQQLVL